MNFSFAGNVAWFPGHMMKATRELRRLIPMCSVVVEIRDARLPRASANPDLAELTAELGTSRVIVYNKIDLADKSRLSVSSIFASGMRHGDLNFSP